MRSSKTSQGKDPTTNVFISYSRKDIVFVDRLENGLVERGFSPTVDREEIFAFEDWWKRIEQLIVEADTIVFVLSPDAVSSEICAKEVKFAGSLKKRFAPIVCRAVDAKTVPQELSRLNFIYFDEESRFDNKVGELADALATNIAWIRKHTEFGSLARRWSLTTGSVAKGLLLRSPVLEDAEQWISSRPHDAPEPTDVTQAFIKESRHAETKRRNVLISGLALGLLLTSGLAGAAVWQRGLAVKNEEVAVRNEQTAKQNENLAKRETSIAIDNETRALIALSNLASERGLPLDAVRLALAAWPREGEDRPQMRRALSALSSALPLLHERLRLDGHSGSVRAAAFSPDGARVATGADDGVIRIWNTGTGDIRKEFVGHTAAITSIAFNSDGGTLITGGLDNSHRVWDASTGSMLKEFKGEFMGQGISAVFSPNGQQVAIVSSDVGVRIFDLRSGEPVKELSGHSDQVDSVAFSPDGSLLVTASLDRTARIWNVRSGGTVKELKGHGNAVYSAIFSPDGTRVITTCEDDIARIFDVKTGKLIQKLEGSGTFAAFSPDNSKVITASSKSVAQIWDAKSGVALKELRGHAGAIQVALFSPNGENALTSSEDGSVRVWNARTAPVIREFGGHTWGVAVHAALSPTGSVLVTASDYGSVHIWDVATGNLQKKLKGYGNVLSLDFSPNGAHFVVAFSDGSARIWETSTGMLSRTLMGHGAAVTSAEFAPDGGSILTASIDKTARIWDAQTGGLLKELRHDNEVNAASFSFDGARIVTASKDGIARIWDAKSGQILQELKGHRDAVVSAKFTRDGGHVVTSSFDNTARVWEIGSGRVLAELKGTDNEPVHEVALSPDGKRIVTPSTNAIIWDFATGVPLAGLKGHAHDISSASYSADGRYVITGSSDGSARIWDVSILESGNAFSVACTRIGHNVNLASLTKLYGLGDLKPICGDRPPLTVDWNKIGE
jgi:WD40 repeat protein